MPTTLVKESVAVNQAGMSYLWSFVRQHHLTVLNLDLKPIFLRSIFIVCNLVYFILYSIVFSFSFKHMIVKRY